MREKIRIGQGYDIHKLVEGRPLILGGIEVPSEFGEEGYSDGDVLIHAIIDAMLGAVNLGDIGELFPPGKPSYRGISSIILLEQTAKLLDKKGFAIVNLDTTIILEKPKLARYKREIARSIAKTLRISPEEVSVKAKTKEGVDATGKGKAVEAYAVILVTQNPQP